MTPFVAIILSISVLGALIAGRYISLNKKRLVTGSIIGSVFLILLNVFITFNHRIAFKYFDFNAYSQIRAWWFLPFAIFLFSVGERHAKNNLLRLAALFFMVLLIIYCSFGVYFTFSNSYDYLGVPNKKGLCYQSTSISCGAAAAATLLSMNNCLTNEDEMAKLCGTHPMTGTGEFAVLRGLRQKFASDTHVFTAKLTTFDFLIDCHMPVMAVVAFNNYVDHWVVILKVNDGEVHVFDPMTGEKKLSKSEFLKKWKSIIIQMHPVQK